MTDFFWKTESSNHFWNLWNESILLLLIATFDSFLPTLDDQTSTGESGYVQTLLSKRDFELWKSMKKVVKTPRWIRLKNLQVRASEIVKCESPWKKSRKRLGEYDYETCKKTRFWIWRSMEKVVKMPRRKNLELFYVKKWRPWWQKTKIWKLKLRNSKMQM